MNRKIELKGLWFDKEGKPVLKDGIALRDIKEDEELFLYGEEYLELEIKNE